MNLSKLALVVSVAALAACSSGSKEGDGASQTPGPDQPAASSQDKSQSAPPAAGELNSKALFEQSQKALEKNNLAECERLLSASIEASRKEKNVQAVIYCTEAYSRLLASVKKDVKKAEKVLEDVIVEHTKPNMPPPMVERLDATRAVLASLYATSGDTAKAEKFYEGTIAVSRKQKNALRASYWLKQYSEYFKFRKNEKRAKELEKEAQKEFKKS